MGMLAERIDHIIGVDTHRDRHTAAVVATSTGALVAATDTAANPVAFKRLLRFAHHHAGPRRVWGRSSPAAASAPA